MKLQHTKGFTLIEVLIASVILFTSLALTAELYSASSFTAKRVTQKARFYQITPVAISAIKSEIHQLSENRALAEFSGELFITNITYSWLAERQKFSGRVMTIDDIEPPRPQFGLFNVKVTGQSGDEKPMYFEFKVATW